MIYHRFLKFYGVLKNINLSSKLKEQKLIFSKTLFHIFNNYIILDN